MHVGKLLELCHEKGSELPEGHPLRKYKGRTVFQGNDFKDENWDNAIFASLSSSPSSMEAFKAADHYGTLPGHDSETSDAEPAYTQSLFVGTDTWVRLPTERWPQEWIDKGYPDSGGYWEEDCDAATKACGWKAMDEWRSVYWHPVKNPAVELRR